MIIKAEFKTCGYDYENDLHVIWAGHCSEHGVDAVSECVTGAAGCCEGLLHCTASLIERFIRRDKNVSHSQSLNIRPWVEQPLNVRSRGHLCFYDAPTQTSLEATDLSDTVSVTVGTPGGRPLHLQCCRYGWYTASPL